jgi:ATP-dependent Lon protease
MVSLPWGKTSKVNTDINDATKILHEDHFGLEKVKDSTNKISRRIK